MYVIRKISILFLLLLLPVILLPEIVEASWGAARLQQLLAEQGKQLPSSTPTTPPQQNPVPAPKPAPAPEPEPPTDSEFLLNNNEVSMMNLINQEREKNGLKPLIGMPELHNLARTKSIDMVENDYFSHNSPTLGSFASMIYKAGIPFRSAGENLAMARNVNHAFALLMASPQHKANMLNPNFTHIGVGIVPNKYGIVVTQLFIMR